MTIPEVEEKTKLELGEYDFRRYPYGKDDNGYLLTDGVVAGPNNDGTPAIQTFEFSAANADDESAGSLVPGKSVADGENVYNDTIKYTWCNIRRDVTDKDSDVDPDSFFYVGFQFPYTVIDYSIHMTSPYDSNGDVLKDATEIDRIDTYDHPFYEHWDLGLPKGIKGDTLRNLRVIVPTSNDKNKIYAASAITVNPTTGESTVGAAGYDGIDDDIAAGRQIVVFDYYIYDKRLNPTPIMIYLGDFNIITAIHVDDEGTLTVEYTHDDDTVFTKKIRWVNGVALTEGNGTAGGHITFTFNNDNPTKTQEFDISWIKGIEIEEDGSLIYSYAGTPETANMPENAVPVKADGISADTSRTAGFYRVEEFLEWVHDVSLDADNGHFQVLSNHDDPSSSGVKGKEVFFETDLDWIKDITFTDDGSVTLHHTVGDRKVTYTNLIKWIDSVTLDQATGQFTINWNYGDDPYIAHLDWTDDIYINEEDGNIYIHHTNPELNTDSKPTGTPPFPSAELLPAQLKLITKASVAANGIVTFTCNTKETITLNQAGTDSEPFKIKVIDSVTLNTAIRDDKHIFIKYNTEDSPTPIGDPINFIEDTVVRSSDWHLLVLYNDPEHRFPNRDGDVEQPNVAYQTDSNGVIWYNNVHGSNPPERLDQDPYWAPDIYWRDMGAIKDQAGLLIGMNVDSSEVEEAGYDPNLSGVAYKEPQEGKYGTGVCGYLQSLYTLGLTGEQNTKYSQSMEGKIVTYSPPVGTGNPDKQNKEFYAYDYNQGKWFFLGTLDDSGMRDVLLATEAVTDAEKDKLSTRGILFYKVDMYYNDKAMPTYWAPENTSLNGNN